RTSSGEAAIVLVTSAGISAGRKYRYAPAARMANRPRRSTQEVRLNTNLRTEAIGRHRMANSTKPAHAAYMMDCSDMAFPRPARRLLRPLTLRSRRKRRTPGNGWKSKPGAGGERRGVVLNQ